MGKRHSGIFVVKQDLILSEWYRLRKSCLSSDFSSERVLFREKNQIVAFIENACKSFPHVRNFVTLRRLSRFFSGFQDKEK